MKIYVEKSVSFKYHPHLESLPADYLFKQMGIMLMLKPAFSWQYVNSIWWVGWQMATFSEIIENGKLTEDQKRSRKHKEIDYLSKYHIVPCTCK